MREIKLLKIEKEKEFQVTQLFLRYKDAIAKADAREKSRRQRFADKQKKRDQRQAIQQARLERKRLGIMWAWSSTAQE